MAGRRIVFRKAPAAAAARRRIMFLGEPAPHLVDDDPPDFDAPISSPVFDVLAKSAADLQEHALPPDGEARAHEAREPLANAADALVMGKPVPAECRWAACVVHDELHGK